MFSKAADHLRKMRVAYLVLAIALIPSFVMYFRVRHNVEAHARVRFDEVIRDTQKFINQRLSTYVDELYGLRAWFMSRKQVAPEEWTRYFESAQVQWRHPGIWSVGYVEKVRAEEKASFIEALRSGLSPNFQIFPEGDRSVYFPDVYFKKFSPNARVRRGQDHFAEADRRSVMELAGREGTPFATGKLRFYGPDGNNSESGLILYMPVYHTGASITTPEERNNALQGFVYIMLSPEALLKRVSGTETNSVIDFEVYDGNPPSSETLLYDDDKILKAGNPKFTAHFTQSLKVPVLNREWTLYFSTLPSFENQGEAYVPFLVLICGLAFSFLLFGITAVQVKARARAERLNTELQKSEGDLAAEKERLAVTLYSIDDGVITTNTEGEVVSMNKAGERLTGWTEQEATGKPLKSLFNLLHEKSRESCTSPVDVVLESGKGSGSGSHFIFVSRNEVERMITSSAAPMHDRAGKLVGVVLVFRDITEKYKTEAELLKESKLESVGMLAGGIAHDFNNILQGIIGNISLARMMAHSSEKVLERLAAVEKSSMRAKDLTHQLLTFARGGVPIKKPLQISKLIKDTAQFALHGSNVEGEFGLSNELWMVEVDEGQFRQLIHNLVVNAMQAMSDGGKVDVRAENVELTSGSMPPLSAGKYVKISIRDFGTGIRPEHMQRVFDPYFTTRKHSSGLGLASAYSIVRKHEGQIQVESTYGAGSTFQIYLPAYLKPVAPIVAETGQSQFLGRGKILVMDDESEILMVLEGMLKAMGYEVDVAKDGTEALERYIAAKKSAKPFSAVIMDLTIPNGMGGKEAIRHLKEVDPEVKAIVSSGYSYDPVMASFQQFGFSGVIPKPYVMDDLGRVLKEVLETNPVAPNRN